MSLLSTTGLLAPPSPFTGSGAWVRQTSPTLVTPALGVATATSMAISGLTTLSAGQIVAVRVVTAAGTITVGATDFLVSVNKTVGAASAVSLPASPATGRTIEIKDGKGDAASNNITITPAAGTIDGAATLVISANYGKTTLTYSGAEWLTV